MVHRPTPVPAHRIAAGGDSESESAAAERARKDRYARTRRAALMAEFEGDLGIDHAARVRALADQQRWIRIKTGIVWTIALMFFAIATRMLWHLSELQRTDRMLSLPFF